MLKSPKVTSLTKFKLMLLLYTYKEMPCLLKSGLSGNENPDCKFYQSM